MVMAGSGEDVGGFGRGGSVGERLCGGTAFVDWWVAAVWGRPSGCRMWLGGPVQLIPWSARMVEVEQGPVMTFPRGGALFPGGGDLCSLVPFGEAGGGLTIPAVRRRGPGYT